MISQKNFNQGYSLIGIIIALVVVGLITGGLYYYLSGRIPEIPESTGESTQKEIVGPEEEIVEQGAETPTPEEPFQAETPAQETPTQPSEPPSEPILPPVTVKNLPSLPKVIKGAPSVNDIGTVSLGQQTSFFEKLLPVVHAQASNRIFLYKSGSFPAQLFYYDLVTGQQRKLTSEGKEIYSASVLDQQNSVVYSIKNETSGVTLRIVQLNASLTTKTISVNALGPINFSLGPDGKNFAYIEGDGTTNYLVVKDLTPSLSKAVDIPVVLKQPLPSGVTNVAELTWSPNGQSVYLLKRPNISGGPEAIIEFNLNDQSVNEIVSADSYKSLLSMPFADGRLFYLSLSNLANPSGILVVEKNTISGTLHNHTETLGATNYLVAPGATKIYFNATTNNDDPLLKSYDIVGFGKTSQEIVVKGAAQCSGVSCTQKFYSYNVSSKTVNEIFSTQFGRDTSTPSG